MGCVEMSEDRTDPWKAAVDAEAVVFIPGPKILTLDLDEKMRIKVDILDKIQDEFGFGARLSTVSPGGNRHEYLKMTREFSIEERIIMQTALGSDPMRELLSWVRWWNKADRPPIMMFETAKAAKSVSRFLGHGPTTEEEWRDS